MFSVIQWGYRYRIVGIPVPNQWGNRKTGISCRYRSPDTGFRKPVFCDPYARPNFGLDLFDVFTRSEILLDDQTEVLVFPRSFNLWAVTIVSVTVLLIVTSSNEGGAPGPAKNMYCVFLAFSTSPLILIQEDVCVMASMASAARISGPFPLRRRTASSAKVTILGVVRLSVYIGQGHVV